MLILLVKRCLARMGWAQYLLLALLTTAVLSGCGGGGGGGVSLNAGAAPPADGGGGGGGDAPAASEVVVDVGAGGAAGRRVEVQDVAGRMVTVEIRAEYYQPQTVRVSDLGAAFFVMLRAVLPDEVIRDIGGNRVTLGSRVVEEHNIRIQRDLPDDEQTGGDPVTVIVADTEKPHTMTVSVSHISTVTTGTVSVANRIDAASTVDIRSTLTLITRTTVTVTTGTLSLTNRIDAASTINITSTLTLISRATVTAIVSTVNSPAAITLPLGAGERPPAGEAVVVQTIDSTVYAATLRIVNITGLVSVDIGGAGGGSRSGDSSSFVYSYRDSGGKWRPLPADIQARLISQGVLSPPAAISVYGPRVTATVRATVAVTVTRIYPVTVTTVYENLVTATLYTTLTATYEAILTMTRDMTVTTVYENLVTATVNTTLTETYKATLTTTRDMTVTTVYKNMMTATVNTTLTATYDAILTLYATVYASLVYGAGVVQDSSILTAYIDYGVTVGYRQGTLAYVVLPPPSDSDGRDYETNEYTAQYGLKNIKASAAYQRGYFGQGVTIGILDTGALTTHVDLADNLIPGKRFKDNGKIRHKVKDVNGHGTHVAGIAAASRNGVTMHGVAPLASIMPLQFMDPKTGALTGDFLAAMQYAVDNNVQIVNNSWGRPDTVLAGAYKGSTIVFKMPYASPFLTHPAGGDVNRYHITLYNDLKNIAAGSDTILVWAAGNSYWNSVSGSVYYCDITDVSIKHDMTCYEKREYGNTGRWVDTPFRRTASTEEIISDFAAGQYTVFLEKGFGSVRYDTPAFGAFSTLSVGANSGGSYALAPLFEKDLLGNYAVVVAVDKDNRIANFSNGCGDMKDWCIAAPGVSIYAPDNNDFANKSEKFRKYSKKSGTSMAAPHVSGGLAVLKSRFPYMPMPVVLAILFETAEDLGDLGVDEVYGHGLMDLDHATSVQGSVNLVIPGGDVAGNLKVVASRSAVGAPFAGFARQLEQVSIAVRYLDDQYYNMPLSGLIQPNQQSALPALGAAAADIMRAEGTHNAPAFGNLSFVQKAADGQFLRMTYGGDWLRMRYDLCADCESSVWETHYLADIDDTAPYFAEDKQRVFGAANLTDSLEIFAAAGLGTKAEESTYRQWGLRWAETAGGDVRWLAEYSGIYEDGSFLGSALQGGLATGDAVTQQGRLAAELPFASGWRMLADYTYGRGEAAAVSGSMLAGVDYHYSGWNAALAADSLWRANDRMRIGIRRVGRLDSARAAFRRGVLRDGDLHYVSDRIRWSDDAVTALHWGYYSEILPDMELGLGYEYARSGDKDAYASSLQLRWQY